MCVTMQAVDGLHQRGMAHSDLKPENIMVHHLDHEHLDDLEQVSITVLDVGGARMEGTCKPVVLHSVIRLSVQ